MQRILCLDYGEKRIGVALSDPLGLTAQSQPYLANDKTLWPQLKTLIDTYSVTKIIVGLPKNRHGQDTAKTEEIRKFSEKLKEKIGVEVIFQNEAYSTKAVERYLIEADVSRKKRREVVDSQSAAFVLQGYLDKIILNS